MDVTLDTIRDIKLYQSRTGYRFSVDALLLYDFVNLQKVNGIADLGSGSGIVGILLAKKYPDAKITLFEIQKSLVLLAEKNIVLNSLEDRVKVIKADIREIKNADSSPVIPHSFDLIVSNPPFRILKSGRISREEEKAIARHEIKLKLPELVNAASYLLKAKGRFCIVYHPHRLSELMDILKKKDLEPKRLRFVHSHGESEAKMVLLEAVKGGRIGIKIDKPLYIYKADGSYTEEMEKIYNPVI
ncbi:MAG: tRNA1(Val) (adenine(37)-N6)-methyltransferase [Nitrospirota bacterium]|nr:tRNA1(Val) (adenine(37)-N6)-methyltransferase [Nitrospirota bacterium]